MSGRQDVEDPVAAVASNGSNVKVHGNDGEAGDPASKKRKAEGGLSDEEKEAYVKKSLRVIENRAIYASNLPRDATFEEVYETFKKAGIIEMGVDGKPRIKMYTDKNDVFNGDVLIVYFKKESIDQAIARFNDWEFRLGETSHGVMKVEPADSNFKKIKDGEAVRASLVRKDRKAAQRFRAESYRKLAEWSDDDEEVMQETFAPKKNQWAKFVIIKKAFTLDQINDETDAGAILEIKQDMREAAERFGEVTKVVLYDEEPEGVLTVRFKEFEGAEAFVKAFNGKGYNSDKLQLRVADDRPQFRKSAKDDTSDVEDNVRRMEAYLNGGKTDEEDE